MAIHIRHRKKHLARMDCAKLQSLPCKIYADEQAQVSKHFEPFIHNGNSNDTFLASFRGYPLKGRQIHIPESYIGLLLRETISPQTEKEERNFYVVNDFKSFVNWNWDRLPSRNDKIIQAIEDWIDVAEALHSPIIEE